MTCDECEKVQNGDAAGMYFYRVDKANVCILACRDHAKKVIDRLNAYAERENVLDSIAYHQQRDEL